MTLTIAGKKQSSLISWIALLLILAIGFFFLTAVSAGWMWLMGKLFGWSC